MINKGYDGLIDHIFENYQLGHNCRTDTEIYTYYKKCKVVCPICSTRPGWNSEYKSIDFVGHMVYRHGADFHIYK